jgi:hypothetical protein
MSGSAGLGGGEAGSHRAATRVGDPGLWTTVSSPGASGKTTSGSTLVWSVSGQSGRVTRSDAGQESIGRWLRMIRSTSASAEGSDRVTVDPGARSISARLATTAA